MLPIRAEMINTLSKMCSGARRSFFCRMKCKVHSVKEEADTTTGSKYTQSGKFHFYSHYRQTITEYCISNIYTNIFIF
jgi:aryl hydrocarbon receptor nuclear translocator-like protein 1